MTQQKLSTTSEQLIELKFQRMPPPASLDVSGFKSDFKRWLDEQIQGNKIWLSYLNEGLPIVLDLANSYESLCELAGLNATSYFRIELEGADKPKTDIGNGHYFKRYSYGSKNPHGEIKSIATALFDVYRGLSFPCRHDDFTFRVIYDEKDNPKAIVTSLHDNVVDIKNIDKNGEPIDLNIVSLLCKSINKKLHLINNPDLFVQSVDGDVYRLSLLPSETIISDFYLYNDDSLVHLPNVTVEGRVVIRNCKNFEGFKNGLKCKSLTIENCPSFSRISADYHCNDISIGLDRIHSSKHSLLVGCEDNVTNLKLENVERIIFSDKASFQSLEISSFHGSVVRDFKKTIVSKKLTLNNCENIKHLDCHFDEDGELNIDNCKDLKDLYLKDKMKSISLQRTSHLKIHGNVETTGAFSIDETIDFSETGTVNVKFLNSMSLKNINFPDTAVAQICNIYTNGKLENFSGSVTTDQLRTNYDTFLDIRELIGVNIQCKTISISHRDYQKTDISFSSEEPSMKI